MIDYVYPDPKHDIEYAKIERGDEIANFGKDDMYPPTCNWNPRMELLDSRPPQFELIPIGLYNGNDLLPDSTILDDSYIVYLKTLIPEYDCEVIIS